MLNIRCCPGMGETHRYQQDRSLGYETDLGVSSEDTVVAWEERDGTWIEKGACDPRGMTRTFDDRREIR